MQELDVKLLYNFKIYDVIIVVNTIASLKPEKAKMVENYIFSRASQGQLTNKITENELIKLLDTIAQNTKPANKVIVSFKYC